MFCPQDTIPTSCLSFPHPAPGGEDIHLASYSEPTGNVETGTRDFQVPHSGFSKYPHSRDGGTGYGRKEACLGSLSSKWGAVRLKPGIPWFRTPHKPGAESEDASPKPVTQGGDQEAKSGVSVGLVTRPRARLARGGVCGSRVHGAETRSPGQSSAGAGLSTRTSLATLARGPLIS